MAWPSSSPLRETPVAVPSLAPVAARVLLGISAAFLGWVGFHRGGASPPDSTPGSSQDPTVSPALGLSDCWAIDGLYLVAFALASSQPPGRRLRVAAGHAGVCTLGFLVGGLSTGVGLRQLATTALGNVAAAAVAVWLHQRGPDARSWVPRDAPEAVVLMFVVAPAAAVGALLGAYPGAGPIWVGDGPQLAGAAVRQFSVLAVTVNCVLPLLYRPARDLLRPPSPVYLPGYLLGVGACLLLPRLLPHQPLSWLFVVLAAWTGLLFPIRTTALAALAIDVVFVATADQRYATSSAPSAVLSPHLLTDFTPGFVAHVALMLAVFRANLLALRAEVAERASTESDRREILDGIVQTLTHGLLLTHPDGRVSLANRATERLVGHVPERVTTEWIRQIELQASDVRRIVSGREQHSEASSATDPPRSGPPAGDRRPRRVSLTSQDIAMGGERLNLLLLKDVTAAHDRQQQLEAFAGTVAHDLKTPLAALTGWLEAAAEEFVGDDTDTGLMLLHRAQAAVFRMQKLIDDYLAFAVSRGGVLTIDDVPLSRIVREIVAGYDLRGITAGAGPRFTVEATHVVRADEALTRQLLGNLVGNAVKYARPGQPAHIDIRSAAAEPGWVEVAVADRGRGLASGDEERIFAAFSRSTKDAADVEGIGLGLSMCHAIVTRHGGRIGAHTNSWGGATFRFTLPAAPLEPPQPPRPPRPPGAP